MSKVKIMADATGNVVIQSLNNEDYGYVKVIQEKVIFDDNGFMIKKPISALIRATMEDLLSMNWVKDQEIEGKVVIREQLTPFNKKKPELDLKIAGKTGIVCTIKGEPIYRKTLYSTISTNEDTICLHDNKDKIVAKQAELIASGLIELTSGKPDFTL